MRTMEQVFKNDSLLRKTETPRGLASNENNHPTVTLAPMHFILICIFFFSVLLVDAPRRLSSGVRLKLPC